MINIDMYKLITILVLFKRLNNTLLRFTAYFILILYYIKDILI